MPRTDLEGLHALVGRHLGVSAWVALGQADIDSFAGTTRDPQWIHVDPARAAEGPFGATVAHGFLVLSLCSAFVADVLVVSDATTMVNDGLDRVRFTAPVPVDAGGIG